MRWVRTIREYEVLTCAEIQQVKALPSGGRGWVEGKHPDDGNIYEDDEAICLCGLGKVSLAKLANGGVATVSDLKHLRDDMLVDTVEMADIGGGKLL